MARAFMGSDNQWEIAMGLKEALCGCEVGFTAFT